MKVVKLSALRTGHLFPPGNIPGTHFCYRLSRPQGLHKIGGQPKDPAILTLAEDTPSTIEQVIADSHGSQDSHRGILSYGINQSSGWVATLQGNLFASS